ncbi:MAG: SMC-Scp complex subunit ScpB [Patescibacteria group bacterium]|nr:SMC-Scp complex subunit ScpB [Patescibacteria group bacterium]
MEETTNLTKFAELEALLFYYGEAMPIKRIAGLLGLKEEECVKLIEDFKNKLLNNLDRGLLIIENNNEIQLVTKPGFQSIGQKLIKEEFREQLTPAGLETLTLVAYLGPLPRATIDYIRGVNSSFTLRNLLVRGLIERAPSVERSNVYEYYANSDFLKHLGLNNIKELPEYEKYHDILERFETEKIKNSVENPIQNQENQDKPTEQISQKTTYGEF